MSSGGKLSLEEAVRAVGIAAGLMTRLIPLEGLSARAMEIAIQLRHPIYDCFYLALAERERAPIVSADANPYANVEMREWREGNGKVRAFGTQSGRYELSRGDAHSNLHDYNPAMAPNNRRDLKSNNKDAKRP